MNTQNKKLEPAFPTPMFEEGKYLSGHYMGVTVLDVFAMHVLSGLYASNEERASKDSPDYWAETAYDIAEAMYKEKIRRENLTV